MMIDENGIPSGRCWSEMQGHHARLDSVFVHFQQLDRIRTNNLGFRLVGDAKNLGVLKPASSS